MASNNQWLGNNKHLTAIDALLDAQQEEQGVQAELDDILAGKFTALPYGVVQERQKGLAEKQQTLQAKKVNAQRYRSLMGKMEQYPGRAPNGSGLTGIMPRDSRGWSDMLNEQHEFLNLDADFNRRSRPSTEVVYPASMQALDSAQDVEPVDPSWTSPTYQWAKQDEQERATGTGRHYQDTETFIKRFRK